MNKGWIKIHRSITEWEWWDDDKCVKLLVFLNAKVNYEQKKWKGLVVEPGSIITSWGKLSEQIGWSVQTCRTVLGKLEKSGEVTRKVTNKYQLLTLVKWEQMQNEDIEDNKLNNNQTNILINNQLTNKLTTTKETKKEKEIKNIPTYSEFLIYAISKDKNVNQEALKLKYDAWVENGWKTGGKTPRKIKNWKTTLLNTLPWLKEKSSGKKENRSAAEIIRERHGIQ